jgi:hypothetical protein
MRRLSAIIMLLGAITAALGVFAIVGIERIDLPPHAVRVIAAALPIAVLVIGSALLLLGAFMARVATQEAKRGSGTVAAPPGAPALDAGAAGDLPTRPAAGAFVGRSADRTRAT